jgi:hypothetical protein
LICTSWAVVAIGVALLVAAEVVDAVTGCGSVDPTDLANYTSGFLVNDTEVPVIVADCRGGYCDPDRGARRLEPGDRITIQGACGVTGSGMTSWRVEHDDGSVLGYIAVGTRRSRTEVVYEISMSGPTRLIPTQPAEEGSASR